MFMIQRILDFFVQLSTYPCDLSEENFDILHLFLFIDEVMKSHSLACYQMGICAGSTS